MDGLEQAFYIMAIIFMSLTFVVMLGLLAVVLIIRSKINKIHDQIEAKIQSVTSIAERGGELSAIAKSELFKQAKRALKNAKK